jgi:hypothetical protein
MPRHLLKVGTKRLILTCFETFIEANGKQLTKTNITNKVNSICTHLLYILASKCCSLIPSTFSFPVNHYF